MTKLKKFNTDEEEREQSLLHYGFKIFSEKIAPRLKEQHDGWLVLIDLYSGTYLLSTRLKNGVRRLKARAPEPLIWSGRISRGRQQALTEVQLIEQGRDWREQRPYYPE